VFKAEHRIEESLKRAKAEAGLADYQVRTWEGWHHHQTLSLIATWFLTQETRRGKNPDACADRSASARSDCRAVDPPTRHAPFGPRFGLRCERRALGRCSGRKLWQVKLPFLRQCYVTQPGPCLKT